jgi:hypothetical protein
METAQPSTDQRPALTRAQTALLCGVLAAFAAPLLVAVYWVTQPSVFTQAKDGSAVGRSFAALRFWHGRPDDPPAVGGWDATYSVTSSWCDAKAVAALKVNDSGMVSECRMFYLGDDLLPRPLLSCPHTCTR